MTEADERNVSSSVLISSLFSVYELSVENSWAAVILTSLVMSMSQFCNWHSEFSN